ncbi:LysR family transcriptional regulator [Rhodanobacter soli]
MVNRRLPPLTSLRAFEAAARRSSFKAAAEELFVTPTAISHQIRQLEAHLGLRVLERTPRAVRLTAEGSVLYEATASGFAEIARAVAQLQRR